MKRSISPMNARTLIGETSPQRRSQDVDKKNPPLKGRINSLDEVSEIELKGGIQLVRLNALDSLWP
jgi:hypothetical protein